MTTDRTFVHDGFVYEYDAAGFVVSRQKEPEPPKLIAPFWWEAHPVNTEAAHEATVAMGRGN